MITKELLTTRLMDLALLPPTYPSDLVASLKADDGSCLWKPEPRKCHTNVDTFVSLCEGQYKAVRGWCILDADLVRLRVFLAHSVVEDSNGKLWDITPTYGIDRVLPYVQHPGSPQEFEWICTDSDILEGQSFAIENIDWSIPMHQHRATPRDQRLIWSFSSFGHDMSV